MYRCARVLFSSQPSGPLALFWSLVAIVRVCFVLEQVVPHVRELRVLRREHFVAMSCDPPAADEQASGDQRKMLAASFPRGMKPEIVGASHPMRVYDYSNWLRKRFGLSLAESAGNAYPFRSEEWAGQTHGR